MNLSRRQFAALLATARAVAAQSPSDAESDDILRALQQELERSKSLKLANLPSPYFVEFALDDTDRKSVV